MTPAHATNALWVVAANLVRRASSGFLLRDLEVPTPHDEPIITTKRSGSLCIFRPSFLDHRIFTELISRSTPIYGPVASESRPIAASDTSFANLGFGPRPPPIRAPFVPCWRSIQLTAKGRLRRTLPARVIRLHITAPSKLRVSSLAHADRCLARSLPVPRFECGRLPSSAPTYQPPSRATSIASLDPRAAAS